MIQTNMLKNSYRITVIIFFLYSFVCLLFYYLLEAKKSDYTDINNSNLIRATYPNYINEDFNYALKILKSMHHPKQSIDLL